MASISNQIDRQMKVIVVGATGATGQLIVEQLVSAGHEVVAGGRRPEAISVPDIFEKRKVDFNDLETMCALVRGCDVVVSAIGTGGWVRRGNAPRSTRMQPEHYALLCVKKV